MVPCSGLHLQQRETLFWCGVGDTLIFIYEIKYLNAVRNYPGSGSYRFSFRICDLTTSKELARFPVSDMISLLLSEPVGYCQNTAVGYCQNVSATISYPPLKQTKKIKNLSNVAERSSTHITSGNPCTAAI